MPWCSLFYSFLTLKRGKINSGIATGEKQRYTLYRHFSIITLGVWNVRLNHTKFLMFNCSGPPWHYYASTLQVTSEHHLKFQVLLTHQIFTRAIKNSNLDFFSFVLTQGWLLAGKEITEGKYGQKGWAGRKWEKEDRSAMNYRSAKNLSEMLSFSSDALNELVTVLK